MIGNRWRYRMLLICIMCVFGLTLQVKKDVSAANENINELVTVSGKNIKLNGASITTKKSTTDPTKVSIYLTSDREFTTPLVVDGATSVDLSEYTIYGYDNVSTAYNGDITIWLKDCRVKAVYGAIGNASQNVTVNGRLCIDLTNTTVIEQAIPKQNATVTDTQLCITSGTYTITENMEAGNLYMSTDAEVTIAQDVTVDLLSMTVATTGKLINRGVCNVTTKGYLYLYGAIDNYGEFNVKKLSSNNQEVRMIAGSKLINYENATFMTESLLKNSGTIINMGNFKQELGSCFVDTLWQIGTIYSTKTLNLFEDISTYTPEKGSNIYFAVTFDYPQTYIESAKLLGDNVSMSGLEGDNQYYIMPNTAFSLDFILKENSGGEIATVKYGNKSAELDSNKQYWIGTAYSKPFTVTVTCIHAAQDSITLEKSEDRLDKLVAKNVYSYDSPLYDMTAIMIENDATEGTVTYAVAQNAQLPDGLVLSNGRIYGTLNKNTTEDVLVDIIVTGKNGTTAVFTLTFGAIGKATPKNINPGPIIVYYGQSSDEVEIPSFGYDGTFVWTASNAFVFDTTGTRIVHVNYIPSDSAYYSLSYIEVTVIVKPIEPQYNVIDSISVQCGTPLSNVELKEETYGKYQWISDESIVPMQGGIYHLGLVPYDTTNYAWSSLLNWDAEKDCVVFEVNVYLEHTYETTWTYDDTYHWKKCQTQDCDECIDKAQHVWNSGVVVKEATETITGTMEYSCQCGAKKTETIPISPHTSHTYAGAWGYNESQHWRTCSFDGCGKLSSKTDHIWGEGVVVKAATETTTGTRKYTCQCGAVKEEVIPILPHTNHVYDGQWGYDTNQHWKLCSFDGCSDIGTKQSHEWEAGAVLKEATETAKGIREYTCQCGATKEEEIPILPHTNHMYDDWSYNSQYHWKACTFAGCDQTNQMVEHSFSEVVIKAPTEDATGTKQCTCACGFSKMETIEKLPHMTHVYEGDWDYDSHEHWRGCSFAGCNALSEKTGHSFDEEIVIETPTETTTGTKRCICICGCSKTEMIEKLPHTNHVYDGQWGYDTNQHWKLCSFDGCGQIGKKTVHTWEAGSVLKEATETTTGIREYTCQCGARKEEEIPILPHSNHTYGGWTYNSQYHWKDCTFNGCSSVTSQNMHVWSADVITKQPTETSEGECQYTCECGYVKLEKLEKLPHTNHTYGGQWQYDEEQHWKTCDFTGCVERILVADHVWNEGVVVKEATQTTTGLKTYTCDCGASKEEILPAIGGSETPTVTPHQHVYLPVWNYDSTEHWHECEDPDCDEVSATEEHIYGQAEIVVAATEDDEGTRKYTCATCGYNYTEEYDLEIDETQEPLEEDEEFEDEETQITYMVTSAKKAEIEFVECGNPTATELVIPDTVTYAGVTYKVTSIAPNAFKNNNKLKKIVMGPNIRIIGKKAFYGCKKLSTVKMGKNIETIESSAFQNCTVLKKIEIPSKVKKIGSKAFYGCKKLTNITIKTTKLNTSKVGKDAFKKAGSNNYKKLTVKVPKKKLKAYKTMLKKRGLSAKAKVKK